MRTMLHKGRARLQSQISLLSTTDRVMTQRWLSAATRNKQMSWAVSLSSRWAAVPRPSARLITGWADNWTDPPRSPRSQPSYLHQWEARYSVGLASSLSLSRYSLLVLVTGDSLLDSVTGLETSAVFVAFVTSPHGMSDRRKHIALFGCILLHSTRRKLNPTYANDYIML